MARYDKGRSRVRQSGARGEAEYFRHPQALVESSRIGPRTRIWAFAHILPEAVIGADCNICDHVFVENDVRIGDRVTIKCGVQLWDGAVLEDDVFVGPNATFSNDPFPRSRPRPARFARTVVRAGASIGANATIRAVRLAGTLWSGPVPSSRKMFQPTQSSSAIPPASVGMRGAARRVALFRMVQPPLPRGRSTCAG